MSSTVKGTALHEYHLAGVRAQAFHHILRRRPLQRQKRAVLDAGQRALAFRRVLDEREIIVLGRRIHDEENPLTVRTRHHQVVANSAGLVQQQGVFLFARADRRQVRRQQRFQRGFIAHITRLTHMGDVKQARLLARMLVLAHDPQRILDGHVIAGKRHHLAAELDMECVKGCLEKRAGHRSGPCMGAVLQARVPASLRPRCPDNLRDSATFLMPSDHGGSRLLRRWDGGEPHPLSSVCLSRGPSA